MKIATYNLWNTKPIPPLRLSILVREILDLNADVIAIQEVPANFANNTNNGFIQQLAETTNFPFNAFCKHPREDEGLGFLSKYPILSSLTGWETEDTALCKEHSIRIIIENEGRSVAFTNVHLDGVPLPTSHREKQVCAINAWITKHTSKGTYEILLGDFNCYPDSSVHRFLCGQQSLLDESTYWHDLALVHLHKSGSRPETTLDFTGNSRWWHQNTLEINARFDWIMFKDCAPAPYPHIDQVGVFGNQVAKAISGHPSDHYGVYAVLGW